MMHRTALVLSFLIARANPAGADSPAVSSQTASVGSSGLPDHDAVLRAIEDKISKTYVFPKLRPAIVAQFERSRKAHRYDIADPDAFARKVTEDLRAAANNDGHLYLDSDPAEYAAAMAPKKGDQGLGCE